MDTGVAMFPTHDAIGPGELAALVEERGHGSLWFPEHTHIPASRDSPFPGGGEMPRRYAHTYDLFVAMTAAAVATRRLRIGQRHLPDHRARPDHHREGGREHRPPLRRPRGVRRRRRLEPRGDGQPRHGSDPPLLAHARARRGDEGDLDCRRGQLPRRARELRAHLVVPQAGPAAAPAGGDRRQRREGARPRAPLRRRVGAPAPPRQRHRADPRAAGARREAHPGDGVRRARRRGRAGQVRGGGRRPRRALAACGAARAGRARARGASRTPSASCAANDRRVHPRHAGRARVRGRRARDDRRLRLAGRRVRRDPPALRRAARRRRLAAGRATRRATRTAAWAAASASGCCSAPATAR